MPVFIIIMIVTAVGIMHINIIHTISILSLFSRIIITITVSFCLGGISFNERVLDAPGSTRRMQVQGLEIFEGGQEASLGVCQYKRRGHKAKLHKLPQHRSRAPTPSFSCPLSYRTWFQHNAPVTGECVDEIAHTSCGLAMIMLRFHVNVRDPGISLQSPDTRVVEHAQTFDSKYLRTRFGFHPLFLLAWELFLGMGL